MFPNPQDALPLPQRPNLEQYKKLAKELLKAAKSADDDAIRLWATKWIKRLVKLSGLEITRQMPVAVEHWVRQVDEFARRQLTEQRTLAQAQFVIARASGFTSWSQLVNHLKNFGGAASRVSAFEKAADAIVNGDLATLRRLLRQYPELVRVRSTREHRATLLHYVSANGVEGYRQKTPKNIVKITELLLKAGAEVDAEADVYGGGATALGLAATSCHPEAAGVQNALMQLLLDHGAVIEQPGVAGNGQGAVTGCLANGRGAAAEFLANSGACLDLEGAAGVGRLDVVKTFFNPDGSLKPTATREQMKSGFAWACEYGRTSVVEFLLQQGMELDARLKHNGQTGLHWAAYGGHADLVKLLLERNAPVNLKDESFDGTPLGWALYGWGESPQRGNYYEVVGLLVKAGATVKSEWLADPDREIPITAKIAGDPRMVAALRGESPR
jgi:ankyrin repeat protein